MQQNTTSTTDAIRKMAVGSELSFPIEKADTVRMIIWTRLLPERQNGARWSSMVDRTDGKIVIKRIS